MAMTGIRIDYACLEGRTSMLCFRSACLVAWVVRLPAEVPVPRGRPVSESQER